MKIFQKMLCKGQLTFKPENDALVNEPENTHHEKITHPKNWDILKSLLIADFMLQVTKFRKITTWHFRK